MAYPSNYYTPGGNYFTSTANGVTTGMGGSVAAAPASSYTSGQVTDYLNGTNGQGASYWTGMDQVNRTFLDSMGRAPDAQARTYYDGLISSGGDINGILANIQNSPEAQAYATSGVSSVNPSSNISSPYTAGKVAEYNALLASKGLAPSTFTPNTEGYAGPTFDPNSASSRQAQAILDGTSGGGLNRRSGRPGSNEGAGSPTGSAYQPYNPYLTTMVDDITRRSQDALGQGLNMIDQQAIGAGGYGGSRQGVAQAGAISQSNDNLTGQIANLLGGDWTNEQGRQVQRYGIDKNYDLGMTNATNNFTLGQGQLQLGNRNTDISQALAGANIWNMGNQAEWNPINQANGIYSGYTGTGTTTQNGTQGGGAVGLLGGALGGAQIANNMMGGDYRRYLNPNGSYQPGYEYLYSM